MLKVTGRALVFAAGLVSCCAPLWANSIGITIAGSTTSIADGQPADMSDTANSIGYTFDISPDDLGYRIQGTILATTNPGVSAKTVVTDFTVENVGDGSLSDLFQVVHNFPPIGGFFNDEIPVLIAPSTSASLSGEYDNGSGRIGFADIVLKPFAVRDTPDLVPIGIIDPAGVSDVDIGTSGPPVFEGSSGPIDAAPVTQHRAELEFQLGSEGDRLHLPTSAIVATDLSPLDIPTLSSTALALFGILLGLVAMSFLLRVRG